MRRVVERADRMNNDLSFHWNHLVPAKKDPYTCICVHPTCITISYSPPLHPSTPALSHVNVRWQDEGKEQDKVGIRQVSIVVKWEVMVLNFI